MVWFNKKIARQNGRAFFMETGVGLDILNLRMLSFAYFCSVTGITLVTVIFIGFSSPRASSPT